MSGMPLLNAPSIEIAHDGFALLFAVATPAERFGFAALIGLLIGSFLSVVVYRIPIMLQRAWESELHQLTQSREPATPPAHDIGEPAPHPASPLRFNLCVPRSNCTECGHPIRVWENIPVLSFVLLRGRCSACGTPIGFIYPLLEILTALLAVLTLWRFGLSWQTLCGFGLGSTLLALGFIDARTGLLPDAITLPLLWTGLLVNLGSVFTTPESAILGAAAGYLALWLVYWIFKLVSGREGIGYGDFKLFAALGAWLGWQALPAILLVAAMAGAVTGLTAMMLGWIKREEPLPFGPFLAAAALLMLLGNLSIESWLGN
jgi:leader peptidase (prepilin peptidase)/N-methyltransferase